MKIECKTETSIKVMRIVIGTISIIFLLYYLLFLYINDLANILHAFSYFAIAIFMFVEHGDSKSWLIKLSFISFFASSILECISSQIFIISNNIDYRYNIFSLLNLIIMPIFQFVISGIWVLLIFNNKIGNRSSKILAIIYIIIFIIYTFSRIYNLYGYSLIYNLIYLLPFVLYILFYPKNYIYKKVVKVNNTNYSPLYFNPEAELINLEIQYKNSQITADEYKIKRQEIINRI